MMPFEEHLLRREGKTPAPANGKRQHWIGGAACAVLALVAIGGGAFSPAPPAAPAQQARVGDRVYFSESASVCRTFAVFLYEDYAKVRSSLCVRVSAKSYGKVTSAEQSFYFITTDHGPSGWVSGTGDFTVVTPAPQQDAPAPKKPVGEKL